MEEQLIDLEGVNFLSIGATVSFFINDEIATETGCHNEVNGIKNTF